MQANQPDKLIGILGDISIVSGGGLARVLVDDRTVLTLDDSNGNLEDLANLLVQASTHPVLENYPSKSLDEDFDHFLAYSGLHAESDDVKAKIKIAYADQWAPSVIPVVL
jgi:hypothetical protein